MGLGKEKKKKNTHTQESLKSSPLVGGSTQKPETEPGWNLAQIFWGRAPSISDEMLPKR